tara:strand:+ start:10088 stop:11074 length:987 start_codon:yes stop_codon:yes gene_type:complete
MQIGNHKLSSNIMLAPMAGVTDLPFRQLCRQNGAGLTTSEMITSDTSLYGSKKTLSRLRHDNENAPISIQIVGGNPTQMATAAKINADNGAQIIDINMGCPKKKVCKLDAGSALLNNEILVGKILEKTVKSVDIPVTLKIRTGWDANNKNGLKIAQIAELEGIQALAVHGRTRACGFSGSAEYEVISEIKNSVKIPIIANGDITTPEKALEVLKRTKADAVMIGRAAQGRPWIFKEINYFLRTGKKLPEPSKRLICSLLLYHLDKLYSFYGEDIGIRIARKHIAWYSKTQINGNVFRAEINKVCTTKDQIQLIKNYFRELEDRTERVA